MVPGPRNSATAAGREQGYVLLTALWLLLLAGTVAGLMLMASVERSRDIKADVLEAQANHALDGALATVVADRLFRGTASAWARVPAARDVDIAGVSVRVELSDEAARLDLNAAAPDILGQTIRERGEAWGLTGDQEPATLASILAHRAAGVPFRTAREAGRLLPVDDSPDIIGGVTVATGAAAPRAETSGSPNGVGLSARPIDPVRVRAVLRSNNGSHEKTLVGRVTGVREQPFSVLDRFARTTSEFRQSE